VLGYYRAVLPDKIHSTAKALRKLAFIPSTDTTNFFPIGIRKHNGNPFRRVWEELIERNYTHSSS
jgi:hypothetical protein